MILEFSVKNFLSFKEKVTFSMIANSNKELNDNYVEIGGNKVLKSAAIYGANASGKSNLFKILTLVVLMLRSSNSVDINAKLPLIPFKLDKGSVNKPSEFEIKFILDETRYVYGFIADKDKIYDEYLYYYPNGRETKIFDRTNINEYSYTQKDEKILREIEAKNAQNKFFLATATNWNFDKTKAAYNFLTNGIGTCNNLEILKNMAYKMYETNPDYLKDFAIDFLQKADFNIEDYQISQIDVPGEFLTAIPEFITKTLPDKPKAYQVLFKHKNSDNYLSIDEESLGTQMIFAFIPFLADSLKNKKVLIRVDFNVPIKDGKIVDDNRIRQSLKTIKFAIEKNAKVILLSHLGRIKTEEDLKKYSLKMVADRLSELLNKKVIFVNKTRGQELEEAINEMKFKDVLLIENTRFEDLDGKKESSNDSSLGLYWASLGDIFINDAFGTSHRAHASNVGIASHLPSGIGFLVEKELNIMLPAINNPKRPLTVILGGSKVSDKIGVIENLVKIADNILIGGGMAFTFLKAKKIEIGTSLLDKDNIEFCKNILSKYEDKIILPIDAVVTNEISDNSNYRKCFITDIKPNEIGVDIGTQTLELFDDFLSSSKTIIWNGPVGIFEIPNFSNGTKKLLELISKKDAITIIGGGDTASSAIQFGFEHSFTHISTGGGASLELLEGKKLPGISIISDK